MSGSSLRAPAIVAAALVIRTAVGELRHPGSAREQWAFATDRRAVAAAAVVVLGWQQAGPATAAWALLIGALTAHLVHRDWDRDRS
ncbi:hypothetical protein ACI2L1_15700 [Streptomyces sp. NPDC019531]|uniref:hypothetical protein n=1 Tax=Streptomyces sp. NPDC019531 TaxID=3365062 RepID=UPI00384C1A0F